MKIKMKKPITIEWIAIYRDGGTIEVLLVDAKGQGMSFHVDGAFGSPTRDRLFITPPSPGRAPAELIPKGDKREKEIIKMLKTILDRDFSAEEQAGLRGSYGRRQLSEAESNAALALSVIETLEKSG